MRDKQQSTDLEEHIVALGEAHHKDEEDGHEPDDVLGQHPVHHDHHGTHELEPSEQSTGVGCC